MNDIFISYASADRAVAHLLAEDLEAFGWSVWWDREIPLGKPFDQVIEEELNAARCVVVLWSKESVRSRWVKTEAGAAADRDRLIPVLIEDVPIPLEFRRIQTAMLQGWNGDRNFPEYAVLVSAIRRMLGEPDSPTPLPTRTLGSRTSVPSSGYGRKIAIGLAVVLASLIGVMAKTLLPMRERGSSPPTPVEGAFAIKIGDRIAEGVPAPGAGNIESPGAKDVYTFSAEPGQTVYFRKLNHDPGMEPIAWKLTEADGGEVFDERLYQEPGAKVLEKGGSYTLTVGSDRDPATGTYHLRLFNVPPPHQFEIKLGDTLQENMPGPGAGNIESPGAKDVYTFSAEPGQTAYFRKLKHDPGMEQITWKLADADGGVVLDAHFFQDPGAQVLEKGGRYTLTVGSDRVPATGTYSLQSFDVPPPNRFEIKIGDTLQENMPGPGAGHIESPVAKDVYTFNATPGQTVYFQRLKHAPGMVFIHWRLADADGGEVFDAPLALLRQSWAGSKAVACLFTRL